MKRILAFSEALLATGLYLCQTTLLRGGGGGGLGGGGGRGGFGGGGGFTRRGFGSGWGGGLRPARVYGGFGPEVNRGWGGRLVAHRSADCSWRRPFRYGHDSPWYDGYGY